MVHQALLLVWQQMAHNLTEVVDATVAYIDNKDIDISELMQHDSDFPTGGIIYGRGVKDAFETGRGRVVIRAKTSFEELQS